MVSSCSLDKFRDASVDGRKQRITNDERDGTLYSRGENRATFRLTDLVPPAEFFTAESMSTHEYKSVPYMRQYSNPHCSRTKHTLITLIPCVYKKASSTFKKRRIRVNWAKYRDIYAEERITNFERLENPSSQRL